jgi:hypothetical protein
MLVLTIWLAFSSGSLFAPPKNLQHFVNQPKATRVIQHS